MKERPILFSGPMVRALLAGTKTQTRRIVKPVGNDDGFVLQDYGDGWWPYRSDDGESPFKGENEIPHACPYGAPGDRLWVRETFIHEPADYCWEASVSIPCRPATTVYRADHYGDTRGAGWKPSIHMPRSLSRITLEITEVRVERLQDISEADAIAEGVQPMPSPLAVNTWWQGYKDFDGELIYQQFEGDEPPDWMIEPKKMKPLTHLNRSAVDMYRALWIQLHGVESWDANPWVWVLTFRRVRP